MDGLGYSCSGTNVINTVPLVPIRELAAMYEYLLLHGEKGEFSQPGVSIPPSPIQCGAHLGSQEDVIICVYCFLRLDYDVGFN